MIDTVLGPGDTLYLPRGWLHEARTSDVDSLHLTVGINVYTWLDAFRDALSDVEDELGFRRSVDEGLGSATCSSCSASGSAASDVSRRKAARLERRRRPVLDGQLSQLRELDSLTADTELERRPSALAAVEEDDEAIALVFHGKRLLLPARLAEEAASSAEVEGAFSAAELPGQLDEAGRLVLVAGSSARDSCESRGSGARGDR